MITSDEIRVLNRNVQIPILLGQLGCTSPIHPSENNTKFRTTAWWRGGDNEAGAAFFYDFNCEKWRVYDYTGKSVWDVDLIDFMIKTLNMTFSQALDELIFASGKDNGTNTLPNKKESLEAKIDSPVVIEESILCNFETGLHPYWRDRKFIPETARKFELGFSMNKMLDGRLTIPIRDHYGRLVAIQGRSIDDRLFPKYLYNDSIGGQSAKMVLYNLHNAIPFIKQRGWVGVVEGAKSVWRADMYGYNNFVASLSTSVTDKQIDLLMNLNCNIVIMFDFDSTETMTGQIAAIQLANKLLEKGHKGVFVCNIGFHASPSSLTLDQFLMTLKRAMKYQ